MMKNSSKGTYNATAIWYDENGKEAGVQVVRFENGKILAASGHWSHETGTEAFDATFRRGRYSFQKRLEIIPGTERMMQSIRG